MQLCPYLYVQVLVIWNTVHDNKELSRVPNGPGHGSYTATGSSQKFPTVCLAFDARWPS